MKKVKNIALNSLVLTMWVLIFSVFTVGLATVFEAIV